jgi:hypothetical protein
MMINADPAAQTSGVMASAGISPRAGARRSMLVADARRHVEIGRGCAAIFNFADVGDTTTQPRNR